MTAKSHFDWLHRHHEDHERVHRGRRLVFVTAIAMLLGASLDFTIVSAQTSGSGAATPADALEHTADLVAEQYSISSEMALARLKHEHAVRATIARWEQEHVGTFAGAYHGDNFATDTIVRFVGTVPGPVRVEALNLAASDDVGSISFDTTATQSLRELVAHKERVHSLLTDAGLQEVFSGVRVKDGEVAVEVRLDDATPAPPNLQTSDAIKTLLNDNNISDYALTTKSGPLVMEESVYGGDKIRRGSGPDYCTTAFTVVKNGTEGVLTAGHCENLAQYVAVGDGSNTVYTVYLQEDHRGAWGDMAWYTTLGAEQPWFYKTATGRYEVNGYIARSTIQVGDTFCLYGRATNHSGESDDPDTSDACGSVVDRWAQQSSGGYDYNRLVEMEGVSSTTGDSGGPWYTGSYAVGIHRGKRSTGANRLFTPVSSAFHVLDVELLVDD